MHFVSSRLTAHYLLLTTYYLLPTAYYYLLPTTYYYLLPTTNYQLPTTYHLLLLTTYYLLLTAYYLLLGRLLRRLVANAVLICAVLDEASRRHLRRQHAYEVELARALRYALNPRDLLAVLAPLQ